MKQFVTPTVNFEKALADSGFTLHDDEWVTKTDRGTYITLSCDRSDTALEWIPKDDVNITDDEFIDSMIGDVYKYEKLWSMCEVVNLNVLELFFSGV